MDTKLALPLLAALQSERTIPGHSSAAGVVECASPPRSLQEPPSLGTVSQASHKRALALSVVIYGGFVAGAMGLTLAAPTLAAPQRTVTVALDTFDTVSAPPARPNLNTKPSAQAPSHPDPIAPPETRPIPDSLPLPSRSTSQAEGGQIAGVPEGIPSGVAGGQVGGTSDGQVGGVVAPRFDVAYLNNPEPDYPALSKRLGEEGRVLLRVLVTAEGLAGQVEVHQSSGHIRLDQAALATVRLWRFTPARRGEERVPAWVLVPLSFQLEA